MALVTTLERMAPPDISGRKATPASGGRTVPPPVQAPLPPPMNSDKPKRNNGSSRREEAKAQRVIKGKGAVAAKKETERPLTAWSNSELIAAVSTGDDRAFAELYKRHKSEIFTYCLRMMSGDEDMASDIFQEVFIRAYEKAAQFRSGTNVTGWLFMIARNMCLNTLRTKKPCDRIDHHPLLASTDRSLAPEYDEEQHSLRQHLEEALSALPIEFREPFMLREFDGFSYTEIATMTGATLAMTKVRIYRAKQRMRELLAPYLEESATVERNASTERNERTRRRQ